MTQPRKKPSDAQVKGYLKKARKILKSRNPSYDLTQMLKQRTAADVLADAIVEETLEVPVSQLRVVYSVLSQPDQIDKLSSLAMFELGRDGKDEQIREHSERALAARALEGSDASAFAERVAAHISPETHSNTPAPMDVPRWSVAEIAAALELPEPDVESGIEALVATNGGSRVAWCRAHHDGRHSYSAAGVFECLRYPSAFEIERLVAEGDFEGLNEALAAVGAKRNGADESAPALVWRDGTEVTVEARAWILLHVRARSGVSQRSERDAHEGVRDALDLIRDAVDEVSARAFARWVATFEGKDAPGCVIPHPAAFEEIVRLVLDGVEVPPALLGGLTRYRRGRRALLRAELAWPQFRHEHAQAFFTRCHDGWPTPGELGDDVEAWNDIANRFLADAAEAERAFPWKDFCAYYLAHPFMGEKVRGYTMMGGGEPLKIGADGAPAGAKPGLVTLRAGAQDAPEAPADEAWEQRAERLLAQRLAARARVPDFSAMAPFPKTRFAQALEPLGFAFALDDASTGRVHRHIMRAERVLLRIAARDDGCVVDRVTVEASPYHRAHAHRTEAGLEFTGRWSLATDFELRRVAEALAALGLESPTAVGHSGSNAADGWALGFAYSQDTVKTETCLVCGRVVEDFVRLAAYFGREPKPRGDFAAVSAWKNRLLFVGPVHIGCARERRPADLEAVIDERRALGGDLSAFEAPARVSASLGRGELTRCARCRRPIKKERWRAVIGEEAVHVDCAREHHPDALARALRDAPGDYEGG